MENQLISIGEKVSSFVQQIDSPSCNFWIYIFAFIDQRAFTPFFFMGGNFFWD